MLVRRGSSTSLPCGPRLPHYPPWALLGEVSCWLGPRRAQATSPGQQLTSPSRPNLLCQPGHPALRVPPIHPITRLSSAWKARGCTLEPHLNMCGRVPLPARLASALAPHVAAQPGGLSLESPPLSVGEGARLAFPRARPHRRLAAGAPGSLPRARSARR
eukprot:scaffold6973_cov61-Phaeocystis_antarctica.AAC.3